MASGSIRAQSNRRRPGKSYIVVSQARPAPSRNTPPPTPNISTTVFSNSPPSTVWTRCRQTSPAGVNHDSATTRIGAATMAATVKLARRHRRTLTLSQSEMPVSTGGPD